MDEPSPLLQNPYGVSPLLLQSAATPDLQFPPQPGPLAMQWLPARVLLLLLPLLPELS